MVAEGSGIPRTKMPTVPKTVIAMSILTVAFFCISAHRVLKHANYNPQKPTKGNIGRIGFWSGIIGMHLGAILFRSVDENTFPLIGLVCFGLLNCFMSIGLTSLQKLYYIRKYKLFE